MQFVEQQNCPPDFTQFEKQLRDLKRLNGQDTSGRNRFFGIAYRFIAIAL
jgi:hypothetical protein